MPLPLLLAPIAGALTKIGGAAALKGLVGTAGKFLASEGAKQMGGQLLNAAGGQLVSNGINQVFGGGNSGGSSVAPPEAQPINMPQMALSNKMAEMRASTQPVQQTQMQPLQTNMNPQDELKRGLLNRVMNNRYGGFV